MAEQPSTPPAAPKRRRWLRVVVLVFAVLIVLLVAAYFVGTSSAFFKGVILPKVSAALNAKVTVSDASISPFKQVVLHDLKVVTTGTEPLVSASEVRARYSLMAIMRGNILVEEVTLTSPTVNLVENPDGSSNLDPILNAQKQKPAQPQPAAKSNKPTEVDIRKLALTGATVRQVKNYGGNHRDVTEISNLNLTVENVKNGQTGKLAINANVNMQDNPPAPGTNGVLAAKLDGNFTFGLSPDLKPTAIDGNARLAVSQAEGALAQATGLGANLDCNATKTEIKQVALRFQKAGTQLGQLLVSGPFDMDKNEGRLTVALANIDKNLLNLAGASSGLDFGPSKINSTNQIQLAKGGAAISLTGQFNLDDLQVTRTNQTTPAMSLHTDYDLSVDKAASNVVVRAFNLTGTQKNNQFLRGELTSPMTLSWGNTANAVGDSSLKLTVTHFNLADWKPFLGDSASTGDVNATLQLLSQQAGKRLNFDVDSHIDNLTAGSGSNQLSQLAVVLQLRGQAQDLKQFNFPALKFQVARQDRPLVNVTGSGTYDQPNQGADLQVDGQVMVASLLSALPQPDMKLTSGTAELKAHVTQNQKNQNVTGSFVLSDLSGQVGSNNFRSFGLNADLDVARTPADIQIRKFAGKLGEGQNPGGTFDVHGTVLTNKSAQITAVLANFNQNGLRPFLEPMLADKKLTSIALNANAAIQYDPQAASSIKANLQVTNLVVNDPKGQFPSTPLGAAMQLDASLNKQVADVRQFQVSLTPTARATNQVQLTGHVDMTDTNAINGNLKLAADSLDLTSYYDLFGGQKTAAPAKSGARGTTPTPAPAPAPAPAGPEQEPPAKQLPLRNFVADALIQRLYLHEVEVTNFAATVKIDGGHVVMNPFKLGLNGAPVNSTIDADLGVPGYKYDVAFTAQAVPLAPLINSFEPDRKGMLSGTFTATAKIAGTGTTGASLQTNLTAQLDVTSTNLNLSVDNIQGNTVSTRLLKAVLDTIATLPELVNNPAGGATSLLSGLVGKGGAAQAGGLSGDLKKSPINSIILHGNAGSGRVQLQQALIQSPAFQAQAAGNVTLAPVLTNSAIQIPVSIWLERGVAERIRLAGNTPTNSQYAKLPDFFTLTGTLGNPKKSYNYPALLGGIGGSVLQNFGGTAGQVGSMLQGLTGRGGSSNAPAANTNQGNRLGGLLQGLSGALGSGTTNTSTNQPATNRSPAGSLLDLFKKP